MRDIKGKKVLALSLIGIMCLTACSPKVDMRSAKNKSGSASVREDVKRDNKKKDDSDVGVQQGSGEAVKLADLKTKYDSVSSSKVYSPMYNVGLDSSFTFHFKSKVDPYQAVTVHTSDKCNLDSRMYIENTAYLTSDGGVDVVVNNNRKDNKHKLTVPVLESDDRIDFNTENIWGNAQQYYISINYDLESETPVKLDEPIIIPFTLKKDVVTPILSYKISQYGDYVLTWEDTGADSYRIYQSSTIFLGDDSYVANDRCYYGLNYELYKEIPGDVTEYEMISEKRDYVVSQNYSHDLDDNYYVVTAVKDGKESSFSNEVIPDKVLSSLPYDLSDDGNLQRYTSHNPLLTLPYTAEVLMADRKTIKNYPVNYKLVDDQYAKSLGHVTYEFEIVGTRLTGNVTVNIGRDGVYEQEIKSPILFDYSMYANDFNPSSINTADMTVINGIDASDIDLTKSKDYNEHTEVWMTEEAIYEKLDVELTRQLNGGVHTESLKELWEKPVVDYTAEENTVEYIESHYGKDVFTDSENNLDQYAVTADNIIQAKMEDDERRIEEGNKIELEVPDGLIYEADFLEEEYLAVNLINQCENIRIDVLPALMDSNKLVDVLLKVIYQNPYVMGIDGYSIGYIDDGVYLIPQYKFTKEEAEKMQQEIKVESEKVISEIIEPGMTDEEKINAIWVYLEKNTTYDHAALVNAEKYNFRKVDHEYETAYITYGILCKKVGVCISYAYTTDLLCKLCNVDAMVLTGYGSSGVGHAWNAINLNNEWYWFDATNTYDATLIQRFIYLTSSDFALNEVGYTLDSGYELDSRLSLPLNNSNNADWYYSNGLVANNDDEFVGCIKKGYEEAVKNNEMSFAIRVNYPIKANDVNLVDRCLDELEACGLQAEQLKNVKGPLYTRPYAVILLDEEGVMRKISEMYQQ